MYGIRQQQQQQQKAYSLVHKCIFRLILQYNTGNPGGGTPTHMSGTSGPKKISTAS